MSSPITHGRDKVINYISRTSVKIKLLRLQTSDAEVFSGSTA